MPRPARACDPWAMPVAAAPRPPHAPDVEDVPQRKLYRSADGRMLGGVARGLAGHLGLPVIWVRLAFLGMFMFGDGLGVLLYAAFWVFVPLGVGGKTGHHSFFETLPDGTRRLRKPDKGAVSGLIALAVGAGIFFSQLRVGGENGRYIWPTLLVGACCRSRLAAGRQRPPRPLERRHAAATDACSRPPGPWPESSSSEWD